MRHHTLTQAERDLIVVLCRYAMENRSALQRQRVPPFEDLTAEDWNRLPSIAYKLDQWTPSDFS